MQGTIAHRGGFVLATFLSGLGTAQEQAREVERQPRDLDLGSLTVDTHVEANFVGAFTRVWIAGATDAPTGVGPGPPRG